MNKQDIQTVLDALGMAVDCIDDQYQRNTYTRIIAAIAILQAALAEPEPFTPDWVSYRQGVADGKEALAEPSEADDTSCPTCGEDGGTSCGMPNCGLLIGESDVEPQNEPVAWQLGHRFYTSLKDAEYAWRNDCAFLGTSYVPEPLFTHPASKPEPSEPDCSPNHLCNGRMVHLPNGEQCDKCGETP